MRRRWCVAPSTRWARRFAMGRPRGTIQTTGVSKSVEGQISLKHRHQVTMLDTPAPSKWVIRGQERSDRHQGGRARAGCGLRTSRGWW